MKDLDLMKSKYNLLCIRNQKAERFFEENPDKAEKYVKQFNELTKEMSLLINDIEKILSRRATKEEKFNGFK